jgi:hypothetical protein
MGKSKKSFDNIDEKFKALLSGKTKKYIEDEECWLGI